MKKIIAFLIMTFIVFQGFSQGLKYGINAGLNYSSFQSKSSLFGDFSYKVGYQLGFIIEDKVNDHWGIRIEPGFVNRGSKITYLDYLSLLKSTVNLNYINVPILVSYSPVEKFSIQLGPEVGVRLWAKTTADGSTNNTTQIYDSNFDLGINAGISYNLTDKLDIGLRFSRGFISTMTMTMVDVDYFDQNGIEIENVKLCNQGFSVLLTYMIN
jgi:hypothetical protein